MGAEPTLSADAGRVIGVYADSAPMGERLPAQCFPPNEHANAARIVECVNAMEGIEDPAKLVADCDAEAPYALCDVRALVEAARR